MATVLLASSGKMKSQEDDFQLVWLFVVVFMDDRGGALLAVSSLCLPMPSLLSHDDDVVEVVEVIEVMQGLSLWINAMLATVAYYMQVLRLLSEMHGSGSAGVQETGRGSVALESGACPSAAGAVEQGASERGYQGCRLGKEHKEFCCLRIEEFDVLQAQATMEEDCSGVVRRWTTRAKALI